MINHERLMSTHRIHSPFGPYLLLIGFSLMCLTGISWLIWNKDVQYVRAAPIGTQLEVAGVIPGGKPLLLHFFNPSCPCSRCNRSSLPNLYDQYGAAVDMVVLQAKDTLTAIRKYRDWELPMTSLFQPRHCVEARIPLRVLGGAAQVAKHIRQ